PKILRLSRPPVDPEWLAAQLAELERLADEGDTLEVVGKLRNVVTKPERVEPLNLSATGSYRIGDPPPADPRPTPRPNPPSPRPCGRPVGALACAPWTPRRSSPA